MRRQYRRNLIWFSVIFFFCVIAFYYFVLEHLSVRSAILLFLFSSAAPLVYTLLRFESDLSKRESSDSLVRSDRRSGEEYYGINEFKNAIGQFFRSKLSGIVVFDGKGIILGANRPAILSLGGALGKRNIFSIFKQPFHNISDKLFKEDSNGKKIVEEYEFEMADGSDAFAVARMERFIEINGCFYISFYNISSIREIKNKIDNMVYYDQMTKLPNRAGFLLALNKAYSRNPAILVFIIRDFNVINEAVGSSEGDEILSGILSALNKAARSDEIFARIGGIEFAVASDKILNSTNAAETAGRFLKILDRPVLVEGSEVRLTASVGVMLPVIEKSMEDSLSCAVLAAREARKRARGEVFLFSDGQEENSLRKIILEKRLHDSILKSNFEIYFQPVVDILSGKCNGVEALARVKNGSGGYISPVEFIPVAETTRLIFSLSEILFSLSAEGFLKLKEVAPDITLCLNVSTMLFEDNYIEELLLNHVERKGVKPSEVVIEITESALVSDLGKCKPVIDSLVARGYSIAVDDFGIGNSYDIIHNFNVKYIKIDNSIIKDIEVIRTNFLFLRAILSICETLGIKTVAEGVEVLDQEKTLKNLHCSYAQGYFYARPMNLEDCLKALESNIFP